MSLDEEVAEVAVVCRPYTKYSMESPLLLVEIWKRCGLVQWILCDSQVDGPLTLPLYVKALRCIFLLKPSLLEVLSPDKNKKLTGQLGRQNLIFLRVVFPDLLWGGKSQSLAPKSPSPSRRPQIKSLSKLWQ